MFADGYPEARQDIKDTLVKETFMEALSDCPTSYKVEERDPAMLRDAVMYCLRIESLYKHREPERPRLIRSAQMEGTMYCSPTEWKSS